MLLPAHHPTLRWFHYMFVVNFDKCDPWSICFRFVRKGVLMQFWKVMWWAHRWLEWRKMWRNDFFRDVCTHTSRRLWRSNTEYFEKIIVQYMYSHGILFYSVHLLHSCTTCNTHWRQNVLTCWQFHPARQSWFTFSPASDLCWGSVTWHQWRKNPSMTLYVRTSVTYVRQWRCFISALSCFIKVSSRDTCTLWWLQLPPIARGSDSSSSSSSSGWRARRSYGVAWCQGSQPCEAAVALIILLFVACC